MTGSAASQLDGQNLLPAANGLTEMERHYKANYLLVQNIQSLLAARRENAKSLAQWAGHRPAWLSKILASERGIKLSDLDKIADFFGLTVAQLFTNGISPLTERRRGERRSSQDRRSGQDRRQPALDRGLHPDYSGVRFRPHTGAHGQSHPSHHEKPHPEGEHHRLPRKKRA